MGFIFDKELTKSEQLLWLSVLRRAVYDFVLYKGVGQYKLDWQRAYQYIFCNKRPADGLTFEEVCFSFGWEPDYIRRLTKKLTRADIKKLEVNGFLHEDEPRRNGHWIIAKCAKPRLPLYDVEDEIQSLSLLRPIVYRRVLKRSVPHVQWTTSAVA